jgi:hypothetical protein
MKTIRQPAGAWSSLVFILLAVMAHVSGAKNAGILVLNVSSQGLFALFTVNLALLGVGSFYYHAALTYASFLVDFSGMLLIGVVALSFTIVRWSKSSLFYGLVCWLYITLFLVRLGMDYLGQDYSQALFGVLLVVSLISEYSRQAVHYRKHALCEDTHSKLEENVPLISPIEMEDCRWLNVSLVFLVIGTIAWVFAQECFLSKEYLQLHSLWHLCVALSCLSFCFYCTNSRYSTGH